MERGVFRGDLDEEQRAVFQQVLSGKKSRDVAQNLQISSTDVERIVRKTCHQLGVTSRMDAARAIATHYRWNAHAKVDCGDRRSWPARHSAAECPRMDAKSRKTAGERLSDISFCQDVGIFDAAGAESTDTSSKFLGLLRYRSTQIASGFMRRILLITLLVVGSTLALSALVSAMQGLNVLMSS